MYKALIKYTWKILHLFGKFEWFFIKLIYCNKKSHYPPVFIIGLPRSGTTLTYQLITNYFEVTYINNFINRHSKAPFISLLLSKIIIKNTQHNCFTSDYGYTKHPNAPSEAGKLWFRLLEINKTKGHNREINVKAKNVFATFIKVWTRVNKKPMVIKNLRFGQRIELIDECFPDSLFVVIKRDVFFNLQSIIVAKDEMIKSLRSWCIDQDCLMIDDKYKLTYKIMKQIQEMYEESLKNISSDRILELHYEDICSDSKDVLQQIHGFMNRNIPNFKLEHIPHELNFKSSNTIKVSKEEASKINKVIEKNGK